MVRDLKMGLEGARFKPWEMPVNQFSGIHIDAPQLVSILSFENVKDYEDYIARLKLLPRSVRPDHRADAQRHGRGPDAAEDSAGKGGDAGERNRHHAARSRAPFAHPFDKFPDAVPEADRKRLREAGLAAVKDSVIPAYVKFTASSATSMRRKAAPSPAPGLCPMATPGTRSA